MSTETQTFVFLECEKNLNATNGQFNFFFLLFLCSNSIGECKIKKKCFEKANNVSFNKF